MAETCNAIKIPMKKMAKEFVIKIRITGLTEFNIRVWAGTMLFKLGVAVIGCEADVEIK